MRTSGLISNSNSANPNSTLPASNETAPDSYTNGKKDSGIHSAEDVASKVWSFLAAAGSLVEGLYEEDEVKLLRLRTKKNELVIIPGELNNPTLCKSFSNCLQTQNLSLFLYTILLQLEHTSGAIDGRFSHDQARPGSPTHKVFRQC